MKKILIIALTVAGFASCKTNYDMIDTGLAKTSYDGNMYEYLKSNSYDWDSIRVMIEYAGMTDYFEGKVQGYDKFTFLGPTNHTIRRWLIEEYARINDIMPWEIDGSIHKYRISDLTVANCREFIKMHMIEGKKIMRDDIPRGVMDFDGISGGMAVETASGKHFWLYTQRDAYNGISDAGAVIIYMNPYDPVTGSTAGIQERVLSSDIQVDNGVVQALIYTYQPMINAVPKP